MSQLFWKLFKTTPAVLGASFLVANSALAADTSVSENTTQNSLETFTTLAQATLESEASDSNSDVLEQINLYNLEGSDGSLEQVTNISELRDVSPGDWAYEALRNLVERYDCIEGYPNRTYRGNRALTRYEFAAGLNACLGQIERLIIETSAGVPPEDLQRLQRLVQEFEAELATLGARVDNLEGRVAFLEDHQFSTTTKLKGEVIFTLANAFGDQRADGTGNDIDDNTTFSDRVRLNFDTSFTGKDRLRARLQAGNITDFGDGSGATGTDSARLGHDANNGNNVEINDLHYRFPVGDNIRAWIGANGFDFNDMANEHNDVLVSSGKGALGRFVRRNPFVFRNSVEQGAGVNIKFSDAISFDVGYFTGDGEEPTNKDGIFNGDYTAISQLNIAPSENFDFGLSVGYSFYPGEDVNLSGSTSNDNARRPFRSGGINAATSALRLGVQSNLRLNSKINLSAFGGYIRAEAESDPDGIGGIDEGDNADLWTWAATVSFLDLGKEGAALSFAGGMPPKVTSNDFGTREDNNGTSYLIEAQYKYPITDNILITPGAYVIINPNHNNNNDTIWVGAIRTTFSF